MLSCQNITFRYRKQDQVPVLDNISLSLHPGTMTMLLGENACGKSTLLKIFSGLLVPESGRVELDGVDLRTVNSRTRAAHIAAVPQLNNTDTFLTAGEMVMLGRNATLPRWGIPSAADMEAVRRAGETMGTAHLNDRRFSELSGGERQRVLTAAALAREAGVLLLDEPTSALDPAHALSLMKVLKNLAPAPAILMAGHDLQLAAMFAHRIILMKDGRIFASGTPSEVLTEENIHAVYGCQAEIYESAQGFLKITLF